jgi:hypothetical protein
MEVASIITSDKEVVSLFKDFILSYVKLKLQEKENDTMYFSRNPGKELEIYYHYLLNDMIKEFSYNYTPQEINVIKDYFGDVSLFIFDVSFKDEQFFKEMMSDFEMFLNDKNKREVIKHVLLSHPHRGIVGIKASDSF